VIRADRYERTEARSNWRNGSGDRLLATKAGDVKSKIPSVGIASGITSVVIPVEAAPGAAITGDAAWEPER
jgi:hypothetical protein